MKKIEVRGAVCGNIPESRAYVRAGLNPSCCEPNFTGTPREALDYVREKERRYSGSTMYCARFHETGTGREIEITELMDMAGS